MGEEDKPNKYLLYIKYNCGIKIKDSGLLGPEDKWITYKGDRTPRIGDRGFGEKCLKGTWWSGCKEIDCNASGGIVSEIEPYSLERVQELGLPGYIGIFVRRCVGEQDEFKFIPIPPAPRKLNSVLGTLDREPLRSDESMIFTYDTERAVFHYNKDYTPEVFILEQSPTEPTMTRDGISIICAAVWAPNREEWIGLRVKRISAYEGPREGFDQRVEYKGPFRLSAEWSEKILKAYESKKDLTPDEVLHTDPLKLN